MDMSKWEMAQNIIDAKKTVDSLLFISNNIEKIGNLDICSKAKSLNNSFYINLCVVLDKTVGKEKKNICKEDSIIDRIYYERDKHVAHKDKSYQKRVYASLEEEIEEKKKEILHVKEMCSSVLPENLTLDFVSHDRDLFRQIYHVTPQKEEEIKKLKHPNYNRNEHNQRNEDDNSKTYNVLYDIEDVDNLSDTERLNYCVVMEAGLNSYEGVQNRQDACIRINVLCNQNMWTTPNYVALDRIEEMKRLGLLDEFEIPLKPSKKNKKAWEFIRNMAKEYNIED